MSELGRRHEDMRAYAAGLEAVEAFERKVRRLVVEYLLRGGALPDPEELVADLSVDLDDLVPVLCEVRSLVLSRDVQEATLAARAEGVSEEELPGVVVDKLEELDRRDARRAALGDPPSLRVVAR